MKNGKLFGKLNIIDLLVILVLVAAAVFVALRLTGRGPAGTPGNPGGSRIRYVVKVTRMDPDTYQAVRARYDAGETQLVAGESLIDGYIVDMRVTPYVNTLATDDGRYVVAEDPYYLNVYYTLEAAITNPANNLVVSQEIRIGAANTVKTRGAQFNGTVMSLEIIN